VCESDDIVERQEGIPNIVTIDLTRIQYHERTDDHGSTTSSPRRKIRKVGGRRRPLGKYAKLVVITVR